MHGLSISARSALGSLTAPTYTCLLGVCVPADGDFLSQEEPRQYQDITGMPRIHQVLNEQLSEYNLMYPQQM